MDALNTAWIVLVHFLCIGLESSQLLSNSDVSMEFIAFITDIN